MDKRDAFSLCHPWVNFLFFLGAMGFGVLIQHPAYIAAGIFAAAVYYMLLAPGKGWRAVLGMVPLVIFVGIINPFFNRSGEHVLFWLFGSPYTLEALMYGLATGGMLAVMLLWFLSYGLVLTSDKFLSLFGSFIPSLALLLTMVLRMIPNLIRKAKQIMGSRSAIGKGMVQKGSRKAMLASGGAVVSSLTDWALEGAIITGDSMRSRGYGSAKRTSFQRYRLTVQDIVLLCLMGALAALTVLLGDFSAAFTPRITLAPLNWGFGFYLVFLMIPVILRGKEALIWSICKRKM